MLQRKKPDLIISYDIYFQFTRKREKSNKKPPLNQERQAVTVTQICVFIDLKLCLGLTHYFQNFMRNATFLKMWFQAVALIILLGGGVFTDEESGQCLYPGRANPPGLSAPRKCWWAKEITPEFHVSGRPTERQMKYAADAGFKSVVSLFTYPEDELRQSFGGDPLPSTAEAQRIAEDVAGLRFVTLLDPLDEWADVEAVEKMTKVLPTLPTPVLLYCDRGYTITFVVLMYLANQTRHDPEFMPRISSREFYNISASMGLDFISRIPQETVSIITGEPVPDNPPRVDAVLEEWMDYWPAQLVHGPWFIAGQISRSHLPVLDEVGFRAVVNLRCGISLQGKPSQEEVNLLNVQQKTGTYASSDREPRQWRARLEETRIDPGRPNRFAGPGSQVNYEARNKEEFGDEVGYQEEREELAFGSSPLEYYHLPVESGGPYGPFVDKHMTKLLEIGEKGPVLMHCASSHRAGYVAILVAAVQYGLDLDWALRRSRELGFHVTESGSPEVYRTYVKWLVTKRQLKEEL